MLSKMAKVLSSLLMAALLCFIAIDAVLLVTSPLWLNQLYHSGPVDVTRGGETSVSILMPTGTQTFMLVFVILSGLALGALMVEAVLLLRSANKGDPFRMRTARSLKRSGWFALLQMALFAAKMINGPTILTLGCAGIFLMGAMIYFVLADLFRSAALLREDNDLTI